MDYLGVQKKTVLKGWESYQDVPAGTASIYGGNYCIVIHDEIHALRRPNSAFYHCARLLSQHSDCNIGLSATPIITNLSDAWNVLRILGHPEFNGQVNDEALQEMNAAVSKARSKAKKFANTASSKLAEAVSTAELNISRDLHIVLVQQGIKISERMAGCGIRRSIESLGHDGTPIINLPLPTFGNLILDPHPGELALLQEQFKLKGAAATIRRMQRTIEAKQKNKEQLTPAEEDFWAKHVERERKAQIVKDGMELARQAAMGKELTEEEEELVKVYREEVDAQAHRDAVIFQRAMDAGRRADDKMDVDDDDVDPLDLPHVDLDDDDDIDEYEGEGRKLSEVRLGIEHAICGQTDLTYLQKFYSVARQMSLHPFAADRKKRGTFPESKARYDEIPSAKLDAVVNLVLHHMDDRQAPPLKVVDHKNLVPGEWPSSNQRDPAKPQKIVIYSFFTQSNGLLLRVCDDLYRFCCG